MGDFMHIPKTTELFDLTHTLARLLFEKEPYSFFVLPKIKAFIEELGKTLSPSEYKKAGENVWIGENVTIAKTATVTGPAIIGKNTEIRPGAYIRGSVVIGENVVIGNSTEVKNSVIFDEVQIPHYNYVGDSVLGYRSHMGAAAIASNFKLDHGSVVLRKDDEKFETGLRKFGVLLGDFSEIGCGSVLNPGTIVGRKTLVYPLSVVRGIIPARSIVKNGAITPRK